MGVSLRHPNRLRRQVAGVRKYKREARSKEPGPCRKAELGQSKTLAYAKLTLTGKLVWQAYMVWAFRRNLLLRQQYMRFWWLVVFRGRPLERVVRSLERLRRMKAGLKERAKLGLPRPKLRRCEGRNYHHLVPKSRGGAARTHNLALFRLDRHIGWHILFKDVAGRDMTLDETISQLISWQKPSLA